MSFQLREATIGSIHRAFRSREVSAKELVELYLHRIEAFDGAGPRLNSVLSLNPDAVHEAERLDDRFRRERRLVGPLHGVPVLLKDSIETAGLATTFGSIVFKDYVPASDARIVVLLRQAGAVVLGKTTLPDFASSWFGHSSVSGETLSPYGIDRDPGGSSSGTGAAVAANLGAVGIGGDTAGSIRVPSSFNGLVGVRVTTGLISRCGIFPMIEFEDTAGPMTRTVLDAALLLDVLVGYDSQDQYTAVAVRKQPEGGYTSLLHERGLEGARIGVVRDMFGASSVPESVEVNRVVERALIGLASAGAEVIDQVTVRNREELTDAATLYSQRCRHDWDAGFRRMHDSPVRSFGELYTSKRYHPMLDFLDTIAVGPPSPEDAPGYLQGLQARRDLQRETLVAMAANRVDALVYPTVQVAAPTKDDVENRRWTTMDFPANTTLAPHATLPAVSVPVGSTKEEMPVGIEFLGRPHDEARLLRLAFAFERVMAPRREPDSVPSLPGEP